jgi:hypothetical protein
VAFHLHRLKLVGQPLVRAGYNPNLAADIAQARFPWRLISPTALAAQFGINPNELTRELTDDERRQWAFYRASARNPDHVWNAARSAWSAAGLTDKQAASIMRYKQSNVSRATTRPHSHVLNFDAAMRLTSALRVPGGPEALLPSPPRDTQESSR